MKTARKRAVRRPSRTPRTAVRARRAAARPGNGFETFAMHSTDARSKELFQVLRAGRSRFPGFAGIAKRAPLALRRLDAETAALRHLMQAVEEPRIQRISAPVVGRSVSEFKSLGTEVVPLTGTRTVKFRQMLDKIPVYGSLVTVELDEGNECLAINSSVGAPKGVDPVARVAPSEAVAKAAKRLGIRVSQVRSVPRLHYYHDARARRWRLVYILEDLVVPIGEARSGGRRATRRKDLVFDAHSGAFVRELPRTPRLVLSQGRDERGVSRRFGCQRAVDGRLLMSNDQLNVHTFDFGLRDPDTQDSRLPGSSIARPPDPWPPGAVSAHSNAEVMAHFFRETLHRNNIDNHGGPMRSSINCVVKEEADGREWLNAYWNGSQMVYGQRLDHGRLRSVAEELDIVGHEMFHGVTDFTARLEYSCESGALNESYSDIIGVLVANQDRPDVGHWEWRIGRGLGDDGGPLRDMRRPQRFDQPAHMRDYQEYPDTENGDWGGVHTNSGIHNHAAYRILTARTRAGGAFVFRPKEVAAMFYLALTQHLTRTSGFSDSRRGVVLAAQTMFRRLSKAERDRRIRAIEQAFRAVGVV